MGKYTRLFLISIGGLLLLSWGGDLQADNSKSNKPISNSLTDRGADLDSLEALESGADGSGWGFEDQAETNGNTSSVNEAKKTISKPKEATLEIKSEGPSKVAGAFKDQGVGQPNEIVNLEFKMEGDVSRLLVTSRGRLKYQETKNSKTKQLVYVFQNTTLPERLERAYDTSEFVSPVALFTLLQVPKSKTPAAKLIIQLREDKAPSISNNERGMFIDFPAPDESGDNRLAIGDAGQKQSVEETNFSGTGNFSGKPIERLEIKNTDIQDVIRLIGRSSGYNIVIGDDVSGKVGALSLENIPWDQAFALVLQSKKLGYVRQGNVLRVATLAGLKSEKEELAAAESSRIKAEPLRTVLIPVSYAKAADLAPRAKPLMTDRGTAEVDERSNSIIVRDVDKSIGKLQKLFAMLDTQPPIVSVSAKIVEMKSSLTRKLGMNLLNLSSTSGVNIGAEFQPVGDSPFSTNVINIRAADFAGLEAQIGLAETDGLTKVLATPSVSVNQNQKATMSQTIANFILATTVSNGVVTTAYQEIDSVLSLDVTPIVAGDGSISMSINVRNEVPQGSGSTFNVDKRNVQTQVLLENGDTAVIGGAFKSVNDNQLSGVPGLMKLPLIGMLFSGKTFTETKNEVLIFLTAKILNSEESFKRTF
jgi:type IV pilus assembly protein PilQ